ncbi:MAG: hypothetical protein EOO45_04250 [Flavobacterium sp.]|nr:MAG: hypothetical protein EOO45_04250 [Flavobacterium sp.]
MRNLTLKHYAKLIDPSPYEVILGYLNPKNSFAGRQMDGHKMPYANVKYCIRLLPNLKDWDGVKKLFEICYDVDDKTFWSTPVTDYFAARKFMLQTFETIIRTENTILHSQATDAHLWEMAGANKLKPYSDTLPLLQLGKILGQYPFDLGRKPYIEIFNLLAQTKAQNEVENEYRKLQSA